MNHEVIAELRKEEGELAAKLRAVRAVLDVYAPPPPQVNPAAVRDPMPANAGNGSPVVISAGLSRGEYGKTVRSIARDLLIRANGGAVSTRDIVSAVEARGIEIRGQSPLNAVSALMSRSDHFINVERLGWKLADDATPEEDYVDDENGASEDAPDAEEVSASSIQASELRL